MSTHNVLLWHVHGSWTTAFVQGNHRVVLPVLDDRSPMGRGRARTWDWPANAVERTPDQLRDEPIDVVIVQRPEDEEAARRWLGGRIPGRDVPLVWLEHNAPQGRINDLRHPAADRRDVTIVHVTATNALFWDCGHARSVVIEHGIIDPGLRATAELPTAAAVINEARRRGRVTGTDLLAGLAQGAPIDLFGMGARDTVASLRPPPGDPSAPSGPGRLRAIEDLPQDRLHQELARRRVYLHPYRWTSLGLALLEAMHLGLPVVALATTEVPEVVPADAGVVSNRPEVLAAALRRFVHDPDEARAVGRRARAAVLERFALSRFLTDWDALLCDVIATASRSAGVDHHASDAHHAHPAHPAHDAQPTPPVSAVER